MFRTTSTQAQLKQSVLDSPWRYLKLVEYKTAIFPCPEQPARVQAVLDMRSTLNPEDQMF